MGPILVIVYVNGLLNVQNGPCKILYFKHSIQYSEEDSQDALKLLSKSGLQKVKTWLDINLLIMNAEKSELLTVII